MWVTGATIKRMKSQTVRYSPNHMTNSKAITVTASRALWGDRCHQWKDDFHVLALCDCQTEGGRRRGGFC